MKRISLSIFVATVFPLAHAAGFDCAKAVASIEKTICADASISSLDSRLLEVYKSAMLSTSNAEVLKAEQRNWISSRNKCGEPNCVKQAYEDRIAILEKSLKKDSDKSAAEKPSQNTAHPSVTAPTVAAPSTAQSTQSPISQPSQPVQAKSAQLQNPELLKQLQAAADSFPRRMLKFDVCRLYSYGVGEALKDAVQNREVGPEKMAENLLAKRKEVPDQLMPKAKFIIAHAISTTVSEKEAYYNKYKSLGPPDFRIAMEKQCVMQYVKPDAKADEADREYMAKEYERLSSQAAESAARRPKALWESYSAAINGRGPQCDNYRFVINDWSRSGMQEAQLNQAVGNIFAQAQRSGCVR